MGLAERVAEGELEGNGKALLKEIREAGWLAPAPEEEGTDGGPAKREFRVVLLKEGLAKSGRYFPAEFVGQIAAAAEGQRAFADHPTATEDRERPVRSVRDVVGFYRDGRVRVDE